MDLEEQDIALDDERWSPRHSVAHDGCIYFSDTKDGRIYVVKPKETPRPVTAGNSYARRRNLHQGFKLIHHRRST